MAKFRSSLAIEKEDPIIKYAVSSTVIYIPSASDMCSLLLVPFVFSPDMDTNDNTEAPLVVFICLTSSANICEDMKVTLCSVGASVRPDRALIAPPGPPPKEYCRLQLQARSSDASTVQFSAIYQTLRRCHLTQQKRNIFFSKSDTYIRLLCFLLPKIHNSLT